MEQIGYHVYTPVLNRTETKDVFIILKTMLNRYLADGGREREKRNLELGSDRIFIHVNIVLVDRLLDEFVTFRFHPSGDKGS